VSEPKLTGYFAEQLAAAPVPKRPAEVAAQLGEARYERDRTDLTNRFLAAWDLLADKSLPAPEREFRFHPTRKWRFDLCWNLPIGVAVELDGATWIQGRHSRGKGQTNDADKINEAQSMGFVVLRFTTDHLTNKRITQTVDTVQRVLRWRMQEAGTA
jgi:very-short-patch-repair endonuclease